MAIAPEEMYGVSANADHRLGDVLHRAAYYNGSWERRALCGVRLRLIRKRAFFDRPGILFRTAMCRGCERRAARQRGDAVMGVSLEKEMFGVTAQITGVLHRAVPGATDGGLSLCKRTLRYVRKRTLFDRPFSVLFCSSMCRTCERVHAKQNRA